ncbi:hypothetical protein FRAHR75_1780002 [Frankia sp. Hr75.2]|nr:hypothetical protein FRAHR75_1780002 [Frankia sp. Hr75.2]SQD98912.1 hypothetical protein FMEAI12_5000004 [Parafrankia sp. Ea1.12]
MARPAAADNRSWLGGRVVGGRLDVAASPAGTGVPPGPVRAPERACATRGPPNEKWSFLDDPAVLDTTELAAGRRGWHWRYVDRTERKSPIARETRHLGGTALPGRGPGVTWLDLGPGPEDHAIPDQDDIVVFATRCRPESGGCVQVRLGY